jgi:dolichol-phosphate mannosyltransferase
MTAQPADLRFLRFCMVGGSGVVVNMAVLWFLTTRGVHYFLAGIAAVAVATTWNFLFNDLFTWRDHRSSSWRVKAGRYVRYWVVTGISSAVQLLGLLLLTMIGLPYLVSNLIGIGAGGILNFRLNSRWTWNPPRSPAHQEVNARGVRTPELTGSRTAHYRPDAEAEEPRHAVQAAPR